MEHVTEVVRGGVQLPHTGARKGQAYCKLLHHVDPDAPYGFGFEGKIYRSGAIVTDAELRPSEDYPPTPVVLEFAEVRFQPKHGRARWDSLYVLWRFDGGEWVEIGRAFSVSWEWAVDLRPLAVRALAQRPQLLPDLAAVQQRIAAALARELEGLEAAQQSRVLGIIHDQLACRAAALPVANRREIL